MKRHTIRRATPLVVAVATMVLATACPPPTPPAVENWQFRATQVTVNEANDCIPDPIFGGCVIGTSFTDEAYVLQIGFRVKIGVPGSAQTFVAGSRDNSTGVSQGNTATLSGARQNAATFNNVAPLDILDLADANNKLEVVGTYVWSSEEDSVGNGTAANGVANILRDALNSTLAVGNIPSDLGILLDLILDNIGSALGILVQNIPLFGLGDDVLGGGLYIGVAAKGGLADLINSAAGSTSFSFNIPIADLPPDIQQGGIFTLGATTTFSGERFDGDCLIPQCGIHTYTFQSVKV